jgi:nucleoside 2-deoxyribosyltransferase
MKCYVAGHDRKECKKIAEAVQLAGHEITSRWLDEPMYPTVTYSPEEKLRIAVMDIKDVLASDVLLNLAVDRYLPGGKFVEIGAMLGQGKPVISIGSKVENMLMYHPLVHVVSDIHDALVALSGIASGD